MSTYERSALLYFDTHGCDVFRSAIKVGRIENGVFKPQEGTMPQHANLVLADLRMAVDALSKAPRNTMSYIDELHQHRFNGDPMALKPLSDLLEIACAEVDRLREENRALREALERMVGATRRYFEDQCPSDNPEAPDTAYQHAKKVLCAPAAPANGGAKL